MGRRATCPFCPGHRRLTVALTDDGLYFCHRCHKGGSVRTLAREQELALAPPLIRKANIPKAQFREWLRQKRHELADEERMLAHRVNARHTRAVWMKDPDNKIVWNWLAEYY